MIVLRTAAVTFPCIVMLHLAANFRWCLTACLFFVINVNCLSTLDFRLMFYCVVFTIIDYFICITFLYFSSYFRKLYVRDLGDQMARDYVSKWLNVSDELAADRINVLKWQAEQIGLGPRFENKHKSVNKRTLRKPWFSLRLWRYMSHLLSYLLTYLLKKGNWWAW